MSTGKAEASPDGSSLLNFCGEPLPWCLPFLQICTTMLASSRSSPHVWHTEPASLPMRCQRINWFGALPDIKSSETSVQPVGEH